MKSCKLPSPNREENVESHDPLTPRQRESLELLRKLQKARGIVVELSPDGQTITYKTEGGDLIATEPVEAVLRNEPAP